MQVTCRYSGVIFKAQGFGHFTVASQHPLFDMSIPRLLQDILPQYLAGRLNEPESRVLFVALLKKSDLVHFDHYATPSLQTIHNNMQKLIATLSWTEASSVLAKLPQYRVTAANSDIKSVRGWIRAWNEAKTNWRDKQEDDQERTAFLIREDYLKKLIRSSSKKVENYAERLAIWTIQSVNLPLALHDLWKEIFKLKEPAIFTFPLVDIQETLEHMEEKLDAVNSTVADIALKHIRKQYWKCSKGALYGLDDFEDDDEVKLVLTREQGVPYVMLSRHERMLRASLGPNVPTVAPQEKDYPTRVAFLVAKAKWGVAQQLKEAETARDATIQIVSSPSAQKEVEKEQEDKTLLDPSFDADSFDTDGSDAEIDEAEGTYEENFSDIVVEALQKLNNLEPETSLLVEEVEETSEDKV